MANLRAVFVLLACCALSCKQPAPEAPPELELSTDLPEGAVDTVLRNIASAGGPRAARTPGRQLGASALPAAGAAPQPTPPAGDVRWDSEPYGAIAASAAGELAPGPASAKDVPPLWRDAGGTWVAVGGRAQVLLIAVDELGERGAPVRFSALTEPWLSGKIAIAAPIGGPSLAHFAALFQAWGEERMTAWLAGLKANRVQVLDNDDQVRAAVVSGKAVVGILSSDEAAKAAASAAHVLVVYPNQKSIGTFVWPTALSVPKNAKHPEAAARLAERLGDKSTEQLLVARVPGYLPLRASIPVPPGVRSAANLVVVAVEPALIVQEIARRKAELAVWTAQAREAAPQNGAAAPQKGAAADKQ